jgi:hypothetical protein
MAQEFTKIIEIQLKSSDLVEQATKTKLELNKIVEAQKELDAQFKSGSITKDAYTKATVQNTEASKALNAQYRQQSKELQDNIKVAKSAETSYNKLAAQYAINSEKLRSMTSDERNNSEAGKALELSTKNIREEMKKSQAAIGDNTLSVGSYENAMNSVLGSQGMFISSLIKMAEGGASSKQMFSSMATSAGGLLKSLLALITNPIVATLVAIVVAIKAISAAIKSSDELGDKWAVTMSKLQRVFDFVMLVLQKVVGVFIDYVDVMMKGFNYITNLLAKIPGSVGQAFRDLKTQGDLAESMAKRVNKLEDDQRAFKVASAKADLNIAELRAKAVDKEKYNATQRLGFLNSAIAIEKEINKEKLRLANEDFLIAKEKVSRNQGSEEALDSLAEKEANLYRVRQESADFERSVSKQKNAAIEQIKSENKEIANKIQLQKKAVAEWKDALKHLGKKGTVITAGQDAPDATANETNVSESPEILTQKQILQEKMNALQLQAENEIYLAQENEARKNQIAEEAAQKRIDLLKNLTDKERDSIFESQSAYTNAVLEAENAKQKAIKQTKETSQKSTEQQLTAVASMFGSMSTFMEEFGGQNEAMAVLSKGLALVEIGLNTAKAVSAAIAAGAGVPFPGNLISIVTGVTAVLSAMVQAKQALASTKMPENDVKAVKRPKFHTGGLVRGSGEVDATLLAGEYVSTRNATSMFSGALAEMEYAANGNRVSLNNYQGGQGMEFFKEAFASALREMKAPIVSVQEITRVSDRIKIADKIAKT